MAVHSIDEEILIVSFGTCGREKGRKTFIAFTRKHFVQCSATIEHKPSAKTVRVFSDRIVQYFDASPLNPGIPPGLLDENVDCFGIILVQYALVALIKAVQLSLRDLEELVRNLYCFGDRKIKPAQGGGTLHQIAGILEQRYDLAFVRFR